VYGKKGDAWRVGWHTGTDFGAKRDQDVFTKFAGKIIHAGTGGWGASYGKHVIVESVVEGVTYRIAYCHLNTVGVKNRDKVDAGDRIGGAGATGNAFGVHVHVDARIAPFRYADDAIDFEKIGVKPAAKKAAPKKAAPKK
jgi:murein DD-endopeptidase MepM/ murein hydrolase activator NlpD